MTLRSNRSRSREGGFILVTIAFLVLMMAGLASGLLLEVHADQTAVDYQETSMQALQIVELGLARSEMEIYALADLAGDGIGTVSGTVQNEAYDVQAAPHPTIPNRWTLTAVGNKKLSRRLIEVGLRRRTNTGYVEAMYSEKELVTNGTTLTDSYDSRLGSYASQVVNSDAWGPYANLNGHIGSGEDITLNGSSIAVRGDAIPGQTSQVIEGGTPLVTGDTLPRTEEVILPTPDEADFMAAVVSNDNHLMTATSSGVSGVLNVALSTIFNATKMSVRLTGQTDLVLPGGTYFFSDFAVGGQSTVTVTGPVKIYVTGEFDLGGGGLINASGIPSNVEIVAHPYALPTTNPPNRFGVNIHGGAEFAAAIYAPDMPVHLAGGIEYYGGVVADQITMGGSFSFHYDEALGDMVPRGDILLERIYWRELSMPPR